MAFAGQGNVLRWSGRLEEYLRNEIVSARAWGDEDLATVLEEGYADGGYRHAFTRAAELLVARSRTRFIAPSWIAGSYAEAGDVDNALDWLERAEQARDPQMPYYATHPSPTGLENQPRYLAIRQRMGLPVRD